jgi:hypothetical protein
VGPGVHLDVNLAAHALRIDGGGRVTVDADARIE